MIFIYSDIEWQPTDVIRLLSHNVDCICGLYPKKMDKPLRDWSPAELQAQIDWLEAHKGARPDEADAPPRPAEWPLHPKFNKDGISRYNERTGAIELASAPTGFLCIRREVLSRMAAEGAVQKIEAMTGISDEVLPYLYDLSGPGSRTASTGARTTASVGNGARWAAKSGSIRQSSSRTWV